MNISPPVGTIIRRRPWVSRRLFPQAAEVIFKGTADLFHSRHFISLYRPTSGLSTVEGKSREREAETKKEREKERGWTGKAGAKGGRLEKRAISFLQKLGADSSARIPFLRDGISKEIRRSPLVGSDDFLFPVPPRLLGRSSFPASTTDDALMTVA